MMDIGINKLFSTTIMKILFSCFYYSKKIVLLKSINLIYMKNLISVSKIKFTVFSIIIFINSNSYSQKAPVKFGKPDIEELEMKFYEADSSAVAVVLCNYGYFSSSTFEFTRVLRIKILKPEGLVWANKQFPSAEKSMISGYTYNLNEKGEIISERLKNESIFENRITHGLSMIRIAMPNVKVGSVIDIRFTHKGLPLEWRFQEVIPVKHSELIIEPLEYYEFKRRFIGSFPLSISTNQRWVAENIPAFIEEPYINSIENYLAKFEIEIKNINAPKYNYYKSYTDSWNSVGKLLLNDDFFGNLIGGPFFKEMAVNIKNSCNTNEQLINAACDSVKKIKWNEENRLLAKNNILKLVYNNKIGNSAEINFMLSELLTNLGFTVVPVALSTRDNGRIAIMNPSIDKLNYVILHATKDNKEYYLDATEQYLPYYLLPKRCLNGVGLKIEKDKSTPIEIMTNKKDRIITTYDLILLEDLSLVGKMTKVRYDYAAYDFRKLYSTYNNEESYLEEFGNDKIGLTIDSFKILNKNDLLKPVSDEYFINISSAVTDNVNEILFNPFLYEQIKENPFKNEIREYPVDYAYMTERVVVINIKYSENYEVAHMPSPINFKLSDNSAKCLMMVNNLNHTIQLNYKYNLDKDVYTTPIYTELREFFNQMIKKSSEYIVLKKIKE